MQELSHEYADNIRALERFFLNTTRSAILFAVTGDERVQKKVSTTLLHLVREKGRTVRIHSFEYDSATIHPVERLQQFFLEHPDTDGLILTGIDAVFHKKHDIVFQLNFGREALSDFGVPMLFWVSPSLLAEVSRNAIDLYNQRAGANLYFEQSQETDDTDHMALRYVALESARSNEDLQRIHARLSLLEEQYAEALAKRSDYAAIANDIVLELLKIYVTIPGTKELVHTFIEKYENLFDLNNSETCAVVAEAFEFSGDWDRAERLYRQSLELREKDLGPYHPDVAASLNNLALLLRDEGKYSEAEMLLRRAFEIRKKHLGTDHPHLAESLNNLASLLKDEKKYAEAEHFNRLTLKIQEKQVGGEHQQVAIALNNLASGLQNEGKYAEAELLYRRALDIWKKQSGPENFMVATVINNLALLLYQEGNFIEAEPLYRRALEIREKQLGPNHLDVANSLNNLALLLESEGKITESELLYHRALAIAEAQLGNEHPKTEIIRNNLNRLSEGHALL